MASWTPKVKKVLRDNKCVFFRQGRGDHEIWSSPINNHHFTVDSKITSKQLANAVMKQAGINHKF